MTVLVVDDEASYRMLLREFLMGEGFEVLTAENGDEALRKLMVIQPEIIISDVYMPVMDGRKLHRAVRQMARYERLPFLFVSGYDDAYTQQALQDPRYDAFVRKGGALRELKETIARLTTPEDKRDNPGKVARVF